MKNCKKHVDKYSQYTNEIKNIPKDIQNIIISYLPKSCDDAKKSRIKCASDESNNI